MTFVSLVDYFWFSAGASRDKIVKKFFMSLVIAFPLIGMAIGYALDGTFLGILYGAGSGMLLGGVLRRLPRLLQKAEDEKQSDQSGDRPMEEA